MSLIFSLKDVNFAYPGQNLSLEQFSCSIQSGERLALIGANGSGKSTLLHLLDGLYFPISGSIKAFDRELTEASLEHSQFGPMFRSQVGFLFQNSDAQLFCPTVEEELAFAPLQLQLPRSEIHRRLNDTLNLLEISHLRDRSPQNLSEGEKKRIALGSLLIMNPSVLLLDEPTAGLDPRSQSLLLDLLEQLHRAGLTLITATHDLNLLPHLAERAIVLDEYHRIAADAPVGEVLADETLLLKVNLIHAHIHRHGKVVHRHPHQHITAHEHPHA